MATIVEYSDLKSMLDLEQAAITDYPDLEIIADDVHAAIENFTGRKIDLITRYTDTGFVYGKYINLKALPIVSVSSIVIDGTEYTGDYKLNPYGIQLASDNSDLSYSVTYKAGFREIPEDIYRAELSQIVYEYQNKNNMASSNFSNDGGSVTNEGFNLLKEVKRLLSNYIHVDRYGF